MGMKHTVGGNGHTFSSLHWVEKGHNDIVGIDGSVVPFLAGVSENSRRR